MIYLKALIELLLAGEDASRDTAGDFVVVDVEQGAEVGRVCFAGGAVSWAESRLEGSALGGALAELSGVSAEEFVARCQWLRAAGQPLLAAWPAGSPALRSALRPHVVRSLVSLASEIAVGRARRAAFRPAAGLGHDVSFPTAGLVDEAFGQHAVLRFGLTSRDSRLVDIAATVPRSVTFYELAPASTLPALPVAVRGLDGLGLRSLLDLYEAALLASPREPAAESRERPTAVLARHLGSGWLIVRESPYLSLLRLGAAGEAGRLLGSLGLLGRSEVRRVS